MEALDLARWQFGITTVYHFIFVPLTIGLSLLVAIMHTRAVFARDVQRKDAWTRMTKFFGSMLIVNFGIGIATGIVQEFQFGMNWSEYARYVGDVFGAPLALEGLAAFFLESVFLGLWIFGWGKLPEKIHLLTIWAVALGTTLSAYFIIAARDLYRPTVRFGVIAMFISAIVLVISGDFQAQLMFKQQPMKMASAEALCVTETGASFSILTIGGPDAFAQECEDVTHLIEVPYVTSFLATHTFDATLMGVEDLNAQYQEEFGATATNVHGEEVAVDYRPNLFVTYWSFRLMMGLAAFSGVLAFWALWVTRGRGENARTTGSKAFQWFAVLSIPMPFFANSAGWVFTEIGRQPWVVHPNPDDPTVRLMTLQGVSGHPSAMVITSLVAFTLVYGVLAVIWFRMMQQAALKGAPLPQRDPVTDELDTPTLSFDY
jgi:cytochrome bd-type quinol oxidase subunit 1